MHDCFIRELKDGARPIDRNPEILVSPCDAIVGACGTIAGTTVDGPQSDVGRVHRYNRQLVHRAAECFHFERDIGKRPTHRLDHRHHYVCGRSYRLGQGLTEWQRCTGDADSHRKQGHHRGRNVHGDDSDHIDGRDQ